MASDNKPDAKANSATKGSVFSADLSLGQLFDWFKAVALKIGVPFALMLGAIGLYLGKDDVQKPSEPITPKQPDHGAEVQKFKVEGSLGGVPQLDHVVRDSWANSVKPSNALKPKLGLTEEQKNQLARKLTEATNKADNDGMAKIAGFATDMRNLVTKPDADFDKIMKFVNWVVENINLPKDEFEEQRKEKFPDLFGARTR